MELNNFIHGKKVAAADGQTTDLVDPSTGDVYATAPLSSDVADIEYSGPSSSMLRRRPAPTKLHEVVASTMSGSPCSST